MHNADCAVAKCLSVRLPHTTIMSKRLHTSSNFLSIGCASLNASSFVWPFLCSAVATRLHRTTWRLARDLQWADTDDLRRRLRSATTQRLLVRRTGLRTIGTARLERRPVASGGAGGAMAPPPKVLAPPPSLDPRPPISLFSDWS